MTSRLLKIAAILVISVLPTTHAAKAAIIVQDDFSATESGTGWQTGSTWDMLDLVNENVPSTNGGQSFRNLATPFDMAGQVVYVRMGFQRVSGQDRLWGGLALFTGDESNPSDEIFFFGKPGSDYFYGLDTKFFGNVFSNVQVDNEVHTMIAEIDATNSGSGDISYRIWVDDFTFAQPTSALSITGETLPSNLPISSIRIRSGNEVLDVTDNLMLATSAADVGLSVPEPSSLIMAGLVVLGFAARRWR